MRLAQSILSMRKVKGGHTGNQMHLLENLLYLEYPFA